MDYPGTDTRQYPDLFLYQSDDGRLVEEAVRTYQDKELLALEHLEEIRATAAGG